MNLQVVSVINTLLYGIFDLEKFSRRLQCSHNQENTSVQNKQCQRTVLFPEMPLKARNLLSLNSQSMGRSLGGLQFPLIVEHRQGMSSQCSSNKASFFLQISLVQSVLLWLKAKKYENEFISLLTYLLKSQWMKIVLRTT